MFKSIIKLPVLIVGVICLSACCQRTLIEKTTNPSINGQAFIFTHPVIGIDYTKPKKTEVEGLSNPDAYKIGLVIYRNDEGNKGLYDSYKISELPLNELFKVIKTKVYLPSKWCLDEGYVYLIVEDTNKIQYVLPSYLLSFTNRPEWEELTQYRNLQ